MRAIARFLVKQVGPVSPVSDLLEAAKDANEDSELGNDLHCDDFECSDDTFNFQIWPLIILSLCLLRWEQKWESQPRYQNQMNQRDMARLGWCSSICDLTNS